ncbi:hypothetical protein BKA67DRAFT_583055 [Truncatella angustata]|uniref:NACHT domain-containing protein n=1 Tax=Truncatella angustata TaxID=152316 RepID=A0A9P8RL33_9PEZI|nr:uncharacterized protein BKA67DRAFT_583055 [Truncatella angustata]KAH6646051.1 hypothetical protein BKA67DRAFT_583055 [Truncatella angustata]
MKRTRETLARIARATTGSPTDPDRISNLSIRPSSQKNFDKNDENPILARDATGPLVLLDTVDYGNQGVDVVLVHGLFGHRVQTWTKSGILWPRDLLKLDMPTCRVIAWGYAPPTAKIDTFSDLAERLLSDISKLQSGTSRPIIFIGHGIGGLIIKEALVTAAMSRILGTHNEVGNIYPSTIGVVFLGTPHAGSGRQSLGEVIVRTAQMGPQIANKQLLQLLRDRSEMFENQRDSFIKISKNIPVLCVRETLPTSVGYMIPTTSSAYDGAKLSIEDLHCHHFDLARFSSRNDTGYKQLVHHLEKLLPAPTPEELAARASRNQQILDTLFFENMSDREDRIETAYGKTCEWILTTPNEDGSPSIWQSWLEDFDDSIFWMSGRAGSGKSTMMKYAFHSEDTKDRLRKWANGGDLIMTSVFLFEAGSQIQKSQEGILRSILWQILSPRPELIYKAFPGFFGGSWPPDEPFNTVKNLSEGFYSLSAKQSETLKLCIFLDGLDEYRLMDRKDYYTDEDLALVYDTDDGDAGLGSNKWITDAHKVITQLIKEIGSKKDSYKICVASRELPVFEEAFCEVPRLRVHQHSKEAITQICATRFELEVSGLSHITRDLCVDIASRSHGDVLWARLVADMLVSHESLRTIKQTLDSLPARLGGPDGLYMRMIENLHPKDQSAAFRIFRLVIRSIQPPCLITLAFAEEGHLLDSTFHDKCQSLTGRDLTTISADMKNRLKTACAGLLEADAAPQEFGQRVVFMHQTAKEFAVRRDVWAKVRHEPFDDTAVDFCLLSGCITHLKCFDALQPICIWPSVGLNTETWLLVANALRYAARIDGETTNRHAYLDLIDELDEAAQKAWVTGLIKHEPLFDDPDWSEKECPALCRMHWAGFEPMDTGKSPMRPDLLSLAVQAGLANYVAEKLRMLGNEARQEKAQELLEFAVSPKAVGVSACMALSGDYTDFHHDMPDTKILMVLLANGADPRADRRVWVNALNTGTLYFSSQSLASSRLLHTRTSNLLMLNRQRWVAAIKALLLRGADPHLSIQIRRGSGENPSVEERTAMTIIIDILEGEPDFALELRELQALVNQDSRKSMGSARVAR